MTIAAGSPIVASDTASTSAGAADAAKLVKTNSVGQIDRTFIKTAFGGDGTDGALSISSGTTTVNLGGARVVIKNYTSISITGSGGLAFSNPHASGTIVILKSQGNVTITSSSATAIDMRSLGGSGGASIAGSGTGPSGTNTDNGFVTVTGGSGGLTAPTGGTAGAKGIPALTTADITQALSRYHFVVPGSGGGSGSSNNAAGTSGAGGRGAGALVIECGGAFNFTTGTITLVGANGGTGSGAGAQGGGGGGAGGTFVCFYNTLTANSGTISLTKGSHGSGVGSSGGGAGGGSLNNNGSAGDASSNGGDGADGFSLVAANTEFV